MATASTTLGGIRGEIHILKRHMCAAVDEYRRPAPRPPPPALNANAPGAPLRHGVADREILQRDVPAFDEERPVCSCAVDREAVPATVTVELLWIANTCWLMVTLLVTLST